MRREPELVTLIKRLAELESAAFLAPGQIHELNMLRMQLQDRWPEVGIAIAQAYVTMPDQP